MALCFALQRFTRVQIPVRLQIQSRVAIASVAMEVPSQASRNLPISFSEGQLQCEILASENEKSGSGEYFLQKWPVEALELRAGDSSRACTSKMMTLD